jgi:peptide-methionine (S)-S-oxide reductase
MIMKTLLYATILSITVLYGSACNSLSASKSNDPSSKTDTTRYGSLDTAYFASGCFWCVEAIFESLNGVKDAVSGYSGGTTINPTYEEVCSKTTGHAEAVKVLYDPKLISYETLLKVYFASCDPTQVNGQGPDRGSPYRSVIFYRNAAEEKAANAYKEQLDKSGKYSRPIAVIVEQFRVFYDAEDYHQGYEKANPDNPYVQNVSIPRLKNMEKQFPELLKNH